MNKKNGKLILVNQRKIFYEIKNPSGGLHCYKKINKNNSEYENFPKILFSNLIPILQKKIAFRK